MRPHPHPEPTRSQPRKPAPASRRIFDAHLHCPDDSGNVWQWYPVTRTFEEFDTYLTRTGVQRGIINSVRSQLAKTPQEFIAGNREVARRAEKSKGRYLAACIVNPLFIDESLREMENCRKQLGMVWVGELVNYELPYEYTIREFEQLVDQAVKLNMVLDIHTELAEMDYIIGKFPKQPSCFRTSATARNSTISSSASMPSQSIRTRISTRRGTGTTVSACSNMSSRRRP